MELEDQNEVSSAELRVGEPIVGNGFRRFGCISGGLYRRLLDLRKLVESSWGKGGGLLMDYVCGVVPLNMFVMKCQLSGKFDMDLPLLEEVFKAERDWVDGAISARHAVFDDIFLRALKQRVFRLGYELAKIRSSAVDSL